MSEGAHRDLTAFVTALFGWEKGSSHETIFDVGRAALNNGARDLKLHTKEHLIKSHSHVKFQIRESSQSRVIGSKVDRNKKT